MVKFEPAVYLHIRDQNSYILTNIFKGMYLTAIEQTVLIYLVISRYYMLQKER